MSMPQPSPSSPQASLTRVVVQSPPAPSSVADRIPLSVYASGVVQSRSIASHVVPSGPTARSAAPSW